MSIVIQRVSGFGDPPLSPGRGRGLGSNGWTPPPMVDPVNPPPSTTSNWSTPSRVDERPQEFVPSGSAGGSVGGNRTLLIGGAIAAAVVIGYLVLRR